MILLYEKNVNIFLYKILKFYHLHICLNGPTLSSHLRPYINHIEFIQFLYFNDSKSLKYCWNDGSGLV